MSAVLASSLHVELTHEGRRLKGVILALAPHVELGYSLKFGIKERSEALTSRIVAALAS